MFTDSRGWVYDVTHEAGEFVVRTSKDGGTFQDTVLRLDVRSPVARLDKVYYVGDGNLASSVGLDPTTLVSSVSYRVDFTTVAILPNGKIAVSFADKTYDDPAIAVLM